jgi:hypothetical protein
MGNENDNKKHLMMFVAKSHTPPVPVRTVPYQPVPSGSGSGSTSGSVSVRHYSTNQIRPNIIQRTNQNPSFYSANQINPQPQIQGAQVVHHHGRTFLLTADGQKMELISKQSSPSSNYRPQEPYFPINLPSSPIKTNHVTHQIPPMTHQHQSGVMSHNQTMTHQMTHNPSNYPTINYKRIPKKNPGSRDQSSNQPKPKKSKNSLRNFSAQTGSSNSQTGSDQLKLKKMNSGSLPVQISKPEVQISYSRPLREENRKIEEIDFSKSIQNLDEDMSHQEVP